MWTDLLLGLSGVLIGAGVLLLLRDRRKTRGALPTRMRGGRSAGSRPKATSDHAEAAEQTASAPSAPVDVRQVVASGSQASARPQSRVAPPGSFASEVESVEAWAQSARTLDLSIRATNAAFAAAGARVIERDGPIWNETDGGHRATYLIDHEGREIAILTVLRNRAVFAVQILRHDDIPVPAAIRIVAAGTATVPRLAEAIAACAWPCVAQAGG